MSAEKKYWVPALERADAIIDLVGRNPGQLKFQDIMRQLGISKSSLFSLLHTLETLGWLSREKGDTYRLGTHYGYMGNAFFQQFDLIRVFRSEGAASVDALQESIQLAKLDKSEILYLDKLAAPVPIQMVSGPGAKINAHATGLGKVLLSGLTESEVDMLFPQETLPVLTSQTIARKSELLKHLAGIREQGFAYDLQEGVLGFNCIAAPIYDAEQRIMAAVSVSMPLHHWEEKKDQALKEINSLAQRLSFGKM